MQVFTRVRAGRANASLRAVEVQIIWGSDQLERRCWIKEHVPERLGPQAPGWAAQENGKEKRLWPIEWGVNMLQFCSVSNSLSHTTLSIKWEVYFSKELCRSSSLCRRYDSACICIMWLYNKWRSTPHSSDLCKLRFTIRGKLLCRSYNQPLLSPTDRTY